MERILAERHPTQPKGAPPPPPPGVRGRDASRGGAGPLWWRRPAGAAVAAVAGCDVP